MAKDGLTSRVTVGGVPVLRVHYTADERKDPRTPEGQAWIVEASQGYTRGIQDAFWRKEMEIEYGALGGAALFGLWAQYAKYVIIPPFAITNEPGVKFYGSYDHGWVHLSAYHVHAILPDGRKYTVWEFAAPRVPTKAIAEIIKGHDVHLVDDGRRFPGNPYAGREILRVADPQLFAKTGQHGDQPFNTIAALFRDRYGVHFTKGQHGGELTVAEWIMGDLWADPANIRYQIFDTCPQLLYELPRLRHRTITSVQARNKNQPEQLVDRDNDAWDSLCQFLRLFPSTTAPKAAKSLYNTFAYWQKMAKTRKPLPNTYSRV